MHLLVGDGIVGFLVDYIEERGNLGELVGHVLHHRLYTLPVGLEEDDDKHDFARRGGAHDDIAHESRLLA